jgi:hypothetical protein
MHFGASGLSNHRLGGRGASESPVRPVLRSSPADLRIVWLALLRISAAAVLCERNRRWRGDASAAQQRVALDRLHILSHKATAEKVTVERFAVLA